MWLFRKRRSLKFPIIQITSREENINHEGLLGVPLRSGNLLEWCQDLCQLQQAWGLVWVLWGMVDSPSLGVGRAPEGFCLTMSRGLEWVSWEITMRGICDLRVFRGSL